MVKVTLLGAGSGFTQPLFTDILNLDSLDGGILGMVDIEPRRLEINVRLIRRILDLMGKTKRWKIDASTDRKDVLKGTTYLISTIEVAGVQTVRLDNDIPLKYGIDQCIGDTIGPGGIMKLLRTLPPFLKILDDAKRLCPDALIMNYTNPMSMMTLGAIRSTHHPVVGLCHSVQGTARYLASRAGVPFEEMVWRCGGINHMSWFTELKHKGEDLYPRLLAAVESKEWYEGDIIRLETMKEFGHFVTESSGHFSEYVPYFRKRKDLIKRYCQAGYSGGSSFYADNWPKWRRDTDRIRVAMAEGKHEINLKRSHEFAADIIDAHHTGRPAIVYGSVLNTGLITNLPQTGVVEVAVVVDKRGYTPTHFGALPEQCAALCRAHMAVYELAVHGVLTHEREAVIRAMMLDPLSAAVCSLTEIRSMAEELFAAERKYIPDWCAKPKPVAKARRKVTPTTTTDAAAEVSSMAARTITGKVK